MKSRGTRKIRLAVMVSPRAMAVHEAEAGVLVIVDAIEFAVGHSVGTDLAATGQMVGSMDGPVVLRMIKRKRRGRCGTM